MKHETQNMIIVAFFIWFTVINVMLTSTDDAYDRGVTDGFAQGMDAKCGTEKIWTFTGQNTNEPYTGNMTWIKCTGEETCVVEYLE